METLAVSSSLSADVDENHVGIVQHVFLPVGRCEGHHVGRKQIVGSGSSRKCIPVSTENGKEGDRRGREPPKASAAAAAVAIAIAVVTKEEPHCFVVVPLLY